MLKFKASEEAQTKINKSADNMYSRRQLWKRAQKVARNRTGIRDNPECVVQVDVTVGDVLSALKAG